MMGWVSLLVGMSVWSTPTSASVPASPLPEEWKHWQYLSRIELEDTAQPGMAQVALTMDVFGHALESFDDLRVINQDFEEVPYTLLTSATQQNRVWLGGELKEVSFVPGQHTHVVVDTGEGAATHNRIAIELDKSEFFAWVEVAASDDGEIWRIRRERSPIYRFPNEGMSSLTISYPDTRARWLRLRILDGRERFDVRGCRVAREQIDRPRYTDWPLKSIRLPPESGSETHSRWEADAGVSKIPVSAVRFEAEQPEFHRAVRVSTRRQGENWREVGWGDIYRHRSSSDQEGGESLRASMRVEFPATMGRYWRVTVLNRNDAPVQGLSPTFQSNAYRVFFPRKPTDTYWLLYGNSRVQEPAYDLPQLTSRMDLERALSGRLDKEETNPGYSSPEPWTEQHPGLLWAALLLSVAVLGYLALRALRSA